MDQRGSDRRSFRRHISEKAVSATSGRMRGSLDSRSSSLPSCLHSSPYLITVSLTQANISSGSVLKSNAGDAHPVTAVVASNAAFKTSIGSCQMNGGAGGFLRAWFVCILSRRKLLELLIIMASAAWRATSKSSHTQSAPTPALQLCSG